MLGNSSVAERLVAPEEKLSSMELLTQRHCRQLSPWSFERLVNYVSERLWQEGVEGYLKVLFHHLPEETKEKTINLYPHNRGWNGI
jgi:hypothetical protein